jgi:hypothetical protein
MSEAQTITSKTIAEELDGWQITLHAPRPQGVDSVTGEPLIAESELSKTETAEEES